MGEQKLRRWAAENGYRAAVGPGSLLDEVREEIRRRGTRGELDPGFAGKWLGWIGESEDADGRLPARSVIGVVVPCPVNLVRFTLPDRVLAAVVPPTYCEDARLGERIREQLLELLPELEGSLLQAAHGRKAVAARLGLTAYGVNNITYCPGLGSLVWIGAYATSVHIPPSTRQLMSTENILPDCQSCGICRDACPTGAIAQERFLLRAERCLTCWNELPDPLPSWLPARAHNCLVGCMVCQEVCPQNEGLMKPRDTGVIFDSEETAALQRGEGAAESALGAAIGEKLTRLGLAGYRAVVGRNLALLAGRG